MIVQEYKCKRCGRIIPPERIQRYGSQPVSETEKHLFQIKHRVSGGEKDVHRWRSAVFCSGCTAKLEQAYQAFVEEGKDGR